MHRFSNYRLTVAVFGLQFQKKFVKTSEKVQKSKFLIFFEASEKCFALNFDNILTWEPNRIISVFGFNSSNEKSDRAVWPDWAIYFLGNFSKPVETIILPKLPTFLGNLYKGVKIFHFSSEIIFGQLLDIWQLFLVTLREREKNRPNKNVFFSSQNSFETWQSKARLIYTMTKSRRFRVRLGHLVTEEFYLVYSTG